MPTSSTARKRAPAQKAKVPRPRGRTASSAQSGGRAVRTAQSGGRPGSTTEPREQQRAAADRGGFSMPSMPSMPMRGIRIPGGTAGNVIWWGGLAAVAAFGVVDWPVAVLIAAGTWVAERHASQTRRTQAGAS